MKITPLLLLLLGLCLPALALAGPKVTVPPSDYGSTQFLWGFGTTTNESPATTVAKLIVPKNVSIADVAHFDIRRVGERRGGYFLFEPGPFALSIGLNLSDKKGRPVTANDSRTFVFEAGKTYRLSYASPDGKTIQFTIVAE